MTGSQVTGEGGAGEIPARSREAFLLELADAMRPLGDPVEVQAAACRVLGEQLGVGRILYASVTGEGVAVVEVEHLRGEMPSMVGRHPLRDFGRDSWETLRAGRTLVYAHVAALSELEPEVREVYRRLEVGALISVPLVKGGRLVAFLAVHDPEPRKWTAQDIGLVEETAERTWAAVERAHAERTLRESEERLRQASTVGTVGLLLFDMRGRISYANPAFEQMSGYSVAELSSLSHWEVLTPQEFMAATRKAAEDCATRGETAPYEKQMIRPDGVRWWGLFAPKRVSGIGIDSECVEFVIDITQSKKAHEALRASHQRFRTLVQNIRDYAIFLIDANGFVTEWTEGAQNVKGYTAEEVVGRHLSLFFTPEDIAAGDVDRELAEAARNGRAEREGWRVRKSGERFWVNEIATAIYGEDGTLQGFTKISRDLSEQKRANDALRQSEEQFRLLVENVHDHGIFTLDPEGHVTTWNPGAERIFGYTPPEILGQAGAILFTPEDRASGEHQNEIATAAREGRASDDRWQLRKDGTQFWANGVTSAMRNEDGSLRGFTKVLRDDTEAKLLSERRERLLEREKTALREAHQAMVMKDEFLAVVSHELRTPLSAMLLWARMLHGGGLEGSDVQEAVESILRSAEAQRQLIEDLLDVSRMMSGKLRLNVREIDPAPTIRAAVDAVRVTAEAKEVTLGVDLAAPTRMLRADPDRLQQVVWNLVSNAVKFTDAGGRVNVRLRQLDHEMEITVSDTGPGISADFLPHVFERFRQADASSTRTHGGLGLGLSISRQLVELHGGNIQVESEGLGKGATFVVHLPMSTGETKEVVTPSTELPNLSSRPAASLEGLRVLLVEDEPETRTAIWRVLKRYDAEVTGVESATAALEAFVEGLKERPYHLLISDIGMPKRNGYELIGQIRQAERRYGVKGQIPAIALTAYARVEDKERALEAGFHMHVPKPVDPEVLVEVASKLAPGAGA